MQWKQIQAWLAARAVEPEIKEFIADHLMELCAVDTTAVADLQGLREREEACYTIIADVIRSYAADGSFVRHPFSPEIAAHPGYTFPFYAATADAYEGRYNLIYQRQGDGVKPEERPIAINAHIDTVAPFFAPSRRGDTVLGRGACDDKGACMTMVTALRLLREAEDRFGVRPAAGLLFMFVTDEETGGNGSLSIVLDKSLKERYEGVIVLECCDGQIHPANRGAVWYKLEIPPGIPEPLLLALSVVEELEDEGRAVKAESDHPLFPDRPVQTNHGILGPYGEFPSRICGFVEVEILGVSDRSGLEKLLRKGLAAYTAVYGDKTQERDPRTEEPKVQRHYELAAVPKVGPQTSNAPAVSCDIGGRAGPLESGRTESPGNGPTNNAFGHGNSKCVCTFGIADELESATGRDRPGYLLKVWGSSAHMGAILENDNALTKLAYLVRAVRDGSGGLRIAFPGETAEGDDALSSGLVMEGGQGFVPIHSLEEIKERMAAAAARAFENARIPVGGPSPQMSFRKLHNDAYDGDPDGALMRTCLSAAELAGLPVRRPIRGWNVSCDARLFAGAYPGMEVITMGAGKVANAHSDQEQVELTDIGRHAAALALVLLNGRTVQPSS